MRIALDVDGVLADVIVAWLNFYRDRTGTRLSKHGITDWDFWKGLGIDQYAFYGELARCWRDWTRIPPTEDGLSGSVEMLSGAGRVDIVTAREPHTDGFVKDWLRHHGITYDRYVSVISGPMKADLDYDVYIDDSPLNASRIVRNGKRILLYSQPWNGRVDGGDGGLVRRVQSLREAARILTG